MASRSLTRFVVVALLLGLGLLAGSPAGAAEGELTVKDFQTFSPFEQLAYLAGIHAVLIASGIRCPASATPKADVRSR